MAHKTGTPNCKPVVATDLIERNRMSDPMTEEWYEKKYKKDIIDFKHLEKDVTSWESSAKQVISDIKERECFGIQKYGKSLNVGTTEDMLQHLYEELLDASIYIKTLIEQRKYNG